MRNSKINKLILFFLLIIISINLSSQPKKSIENSKMQWWTEARYGMFIHWGLYSLLNGEWEGKRITFCPEWIENFLKIPVNDYKSLTSRFNPTLYNADSIAQIAKDAGMKYVVITSKHHEGFALFKSADPFNVVDATPFKRDIVAELAQACRKRGLKFGVYYSQGQDWSHAGGGIYGQHWDSIQAEQTMDQYVDKVALPQVKELLTNFSPDILWWDTPAEITKEIASKFLAVTNNYPNLIMNNRLCDGMEGDFETPECFIPDNGIAGKHWESCMTTTNNWCFSKYDTVYKSPLAIIQSLCDITSKGGNYLLNVGPTPEGIVPVTSATNLREAGKWLKNNGEAVYGTKASPFLNLKWGKATVKQSAGKTSIYLHVFAWPTNGKLVLTGLQDKIIKAYPLTQPNNLLSVASAKPNNIISLLNVKKDKYVTVIVLEINDKPVVYNAPVINSESSVFTNKVVFNASTDMPKAEVRYTTNGDMPTVNSPIAKTNISVETSKNITIKAQSFIGNTAVSAVSECNFKVEKPIPTINLVNAKKGISYKYFRGTWTKLPDFDSLTPEKNGVLTNIELTPKTQPLYYGFVFEGYILVPETNVYRIYLTSDDGSDLTIAGKKLNNDGAHGMDEKFMDLALSKGYHKLRINYFQNGGGDGLRLEWKPLDGNRSFIGADFLCY